MTGKANSEEYPCLLNQHITMGKVEGIPILEIGFGKHPQGDYPQAMPTCMDCDHETACLRKTRSS